LRGLSVRCRVWNDRSALAARRYSSTGAPAGSERARSETSTVTWPAPAGTESVAQGSEPNSTPARSTQSPPGRVQAICASGCW
jgi:hypothetical protein